MGTLVSPLTHAVEHPLRVVLDPPTLPRRRLSVAFRPLLAIPHLLFVGGPIAAFVWTWGTADDGRMGWGFGGALGAVAAVCALVSWVAIIATGRQPAGLWTLTAFYLRWRVRAVAYLMLLRDEFPPFADAAYGARVEIAPPVTPRDRLTVAFRILLALPHLIVVGLLGVVWTFATLAAWVAILVTGRHPDVLYRFGAGVLSWELRVEAYVLLLHDAYPPFSLG